MKKAIDFWKAAQFGATTGRTFIQGRVIAGTAFVPLAEPIIVGNSTQSESKVVKVADSKWKAKA